MHKGSLLVISGPSGTGKGTICNKIISELENLTFSVSMTTRKPRVGEVHGENYYFVTETEFEEIRGSDGFLEYAKVYENYYGTPKALVLKLLEEGKDVILEIDTQGAMNIKEAYPEGVFIFILPPSMEELRNRIESRGTESKESINLRLGEALNEISYAREYDYCVINDELESATEKVKSIITAEHLKVNKNINKLIEKYKEEV